MTIVIQRTTALRTIVSGIRALSIQKEAESTIKPHPALGQDTRYALIRDLKWQNSYAF
jgi:hypothetical protein